MRITRVIGLTSLVAVTVAAFGCAQNRTSDALLTEENEGLRLELAERNEALDDANRDLRDLRENNAQLERDLQDAQADAASARFASNPPVQANQPASTTGFEGIANVQAAYGAGEVTAALPSDVLFDAGKTSLKAAAQRSLDSVARVINESYSGKAVRIDGHTDSDPIRKSGFKSNHHLGFERAYAVRKYLISRGVSGQRISVSSFGPDRPAATKNASRRVEITVLLQD